ncbi:MAG: GNAT family N-acetyltransferase [Acidimicrobiia bacterium]|nr:GNAT family N-acetyltransferase [Acidimicrobiia bacterium]
MKDSPTTFEPISDDQLDEVIGFLRAANPFAEHTWGWETGRFIDWRWAGNTVRNRERPGFFGRCGTVVRREGAVVALVIAESGADDHCILTASEDGELIDAALAWLIDRRDGASLTLLPCDEATWVHDVLAARGFEKGEIVDLGWGYDLARVGDPPAPPEGFVIDSLAGDSDYPEIQRCLEGAFGGNRDRIPVLRSLATNPLFRPELNVVARTADGRIASYCRGTVDPDSGVSIDPVATHPDFQGHGLGKAIVLECFAAQARLGGREIYIGSAPDGSAGSRLYKKLTPTSKRTYSEWRRLAY